MYHFLCWLFSVKLVVTHTKNLHTNASRSISSVSSITSAVVGTYGIVTVRIDITDMAACCTLVKIWKEKLKITELSKELKFKLITYETRRNYSHAN